MISVTEDNFESVVRQSKLPVLTFLFFANGAETKRMVGIQSRETLLVSLRLGNS